MGEELYRVSGRGPGDFDALMVYDHFTAMVLMSLEDFQLCPKGEGGPYVADGNLRLDGPLPTNTHGGNLAEAYAHGMSHVYEAVKQVRGTAINQIDGAENVLVIAGREPVADQRHGRERGPVSERMSEQMEGLPGPALEVTTEGYWLAAGRGTARHPALRHVRDAPAPAHRGVLRVPVARLVVGRAARHRHVYTYTWTDRPVAPQLQHLGVYNITVVELDGTQGEPVRLLTRVVDVERDDLVVDLPVEVAFDPIDDHVALPVFRPRA